MLFILFSLFYICVLYFLYLLRIFFWFRVTIFIFFLISMQHVITLGPPCTFHSAILSLGHVEEKLCTACRAAADALRLVFTSDGVGVRVVGGVIRELMT